MRDQLHALSLVQLFNMQLYSIHDAFRWTYFKRTLLLIPYSVAIKRIKSIETFMSWLKTLQRMNMNIACILNADRCHFESKFLSYIFGLIYTMEIQRDRKNEKKERKERKGNESTRFIFRCSMWLSRHGQNIKQHVNILLTEEICAVRKCSRSCIEIQYVFPLLQQFIEVNRLHSKTLQ